MPNRPNLFAEIMQGAARAATAGIANRRNFLNQQAPIPSTSSAPSMLSGLMAAPQAPQNTLDIRRALQTPSPGFPPQGGGRHSFQYTGSLAADAEARAFRAIGAHHGLTT
jgi:hypothetical protein